MPIVHWIANSWWGHFTNVTSMPAYQWIENTWWSRWTDDTLWVAIVFEIFHYFSMFLLVGAMAIIDLRVMGIGARDRELSQVTALFFPLMWIGMGLNFFSGITMWAGGATLYGGDLIMQVKLFVILLAVIFTIFVWIKTRQWQRDNAGKIPKWGKYLALISLILWIASILASVEVSSLTNVG